MGKIDFFPDFWDPDFWFSIMQCSENRIKWRTRKKGNLLTTFLILDLRNSEFHKKKFLNLISKIGDDEENILLLLRLLSIQTSEQGKFIIITELINDKKKK